MTVVLMDLMTNNLTKTVIAIFVILVVDLMIEVLLLKRISNKRKRYKSKIITRNILVCLLLFFLVKIWVEGFVHFLALLGFVAAALTITQKENILNLTGGLIIMWRQSFTEGDYIVIANHAGIIKNLGIFYFTIDEIVPGTINERTGKTIKVPNSFISLNPFKVYEFDHFICIDKVYYFSFESSMYKLERITKALQDDAAQYIADLSKEFTNEEAREHKKLIQKGKFIDIAVHLSLTQGTINGYKVCVTGHCPISKEYVFYSFLNKKVINYTKDTSIQLLS